MTLRIIPRPRTFSVLDVARAYAGRVIEAPAAARLIARLSKQDHTLPACKHGLHSGGRLNGAPVCPICMVDHGYAIPDPRC